MKRFLTILLASALVMAASGCTSKRDGTDETRETSAAEVTEETAAVPLSADLLDGTWVTEDGFFCEFDMDQMVFADSWGMLYDIVDIGEDHVDIELEDIGYSYYCPASFLPVYDCMELDVTAAGDTLSLLGATAYRLDSDRGEQIAEDMTARIAGQTISINTYYGPVSWSFDDEMTEISIEGLGVAESVDIEGFNGVCFYYEDQMIRLELLDGELIWRAGGSTIQFTNDSLEDPNGWISYDSETDEITVIDPSSKSGGETPVLQGAMGDQNLIYGNVYYSAVGPGGGIYQDYDGGYLVSMRNPFAYALLRRAELQDASLGRQITYEYDFPGGSVVFDTFENAWGPDVVRIFRSDDYSVNQGFPGYDTSMVLSEGYNISFIEDTEAVISFDIGDASPEDVVIYRITSDDELLAADTVVEGGTASASICEDGIYLLSYVVEEYGQMTEDNFFTVDPSDSEWGRSGEAGDVPSLVDMSYIEASMNSVFVVDSPEDLASLTYFINTYPRDGYDPSFFVWVDVVDDIDLSGYMWAPLGTDDLPFCGIFCGNGHTISSLLIPDSENCNGFFGSIYASTVIGVNLYDALIEGGMSNAMAGDTSTTDYIDCHVAAVLPDSSDTGADLFPDYSDYGNNGYHYCSYDILNCRGEQYTSEFSSNYPHPNEENDLENHFDPEHDGTFDYSEDYFFD